MTARRPKGASRARQWPRRWRESSRAFYATHVRDTDNLSKALADGVRDGLVGGDVGLDLQPE